MALPELQSHPVNWRDGMQVNQEHFLQEAEAFRERLRDLQACHTTTYRYGLLPPAHGNAFLDLTIEAAGKQAVQLRLGTCRAITWGGARIEILPDNPLTETLSWSLRDEESAQGAEQLMFEVYVIVDPRQRIEGGEPDPHELPPRYPDSLPLYRLMLQPFHANSALSKLPFQLPIGRFALTSGRVFPDDSYIPPCWQANAHPRLVKTHSSLSQALSALYVAGKQVVEKATKATARLRVNEMVRQNDLSPAVLRVANHVTVFLAEHLDRFRWMLAEAPPIEMLLAVSRLARQVQLALINLPPGESANLLNYMASYGDLSPASLNQRLHALEAFEYDHQNIFPLIQHAEDIAFILHKAFEKLAQRDDYIWDQVKHEDKGVIIRDEGNITSAPKGGGPFTIKPK